MSPVIELYPDAGAEQELHGLHLRSDIRSRSGPDSSYVYAGFISSIDGRIGIDGSSGAPEALRNQRDWRLFQELMVQADIVLVSGRYVRDVGRGAAQPIIPDPADPEADDLIRYRLERGLSARPAVAVMTRAGGFDPAVAAGLSDGVIVAHGAAVKSDVVRSWTGAGLDPVMAGTDDGIDVSLLLMALHGRGHRIVFSAAGPKVLEMLVPALDTLYLTLGAQLLGGRSYSTILEGNELAPPLAFSLESAYLDRSGPSGAAQLFLEFRRQRS